MEWVKLLQDAINYMEEHLLDKINYEDVAKRVFMSSYSFHRTFSLMASMTANEYIRNRRLSMAGSALQQTDISIIDAAYKYGYETPESFSKAFSRFHGVTPRQAKKKGTTLRMFNPLVIKIVLEGGTVMDYKIVHLGARKFIARVRAFSNESINEEGNHSIPDFWAECHEKGLVESIRNLRPDGKKDLYGLCSPTQKDETTFDYGIGVIVDEETDASRIEQLCQDGFRLWETNPIDYVVFKCMGNDGDSIDEMWGVFYKEFLPQSEYKQTDETDFEIYYEKGEEGLFCELWIPVEKA